MSSSDDAPDVAPRDDISNRQQKLMSTFDSSNAIFGLRKKTVDQASAFAIFDFCTDQSLSVHGSNQLLLLDTNITIELGTKEQIQLLNTIMSC